MTTIGEAEIKISKAIETLYGPDEAKTAAQLMLSHIFGVSKMQLTMRKQNVLNTMEENSVNSILAELLQGKPLQYILGETEFYGLRLKVGPGVLIPRPETEELVEWVLEEVADKETDVRSILDIGTGSGCIPIALKKHLPDAEVYGLDISLEALEIAEENAALNNVNIHFIHADILQPITQNAKLTVRYTTIVSNPPYVTHTEKSDMHRNVLDYEPHIALFVPDNDPLMFYKVIADFAAGHLTPGGHLFLEINEFLGNEALLMLSEKGFKNVMLRRDMQGKDRMIRAEL